MGRRANLLQRLWRWSVRVHGCTGILISVLLLISPIFAQKPHESKSKTQPGSAEEKQTAPNNPVKGPDTADQQFMKQAAIGDAAEIQLGQMAQGKASDPKVKSFGERMVKDHSQADDQLKGIAHDQHVGLPTELDPQHKAIKSELSKKSGTEFDKDYIRIMVQEHQKTINKFKHEIATTHDPTLKQFAQGTLPVLQSHLSEAQQIQAGK